MSKTKDFPPPVTKHSSKRELWEELEAARAEIRQINDEAVRLRREVASYRSTYAVMNTQLKVIRAAAALELQGGQ